ncbi:MAG: Uma2 family endonuclease [Salinibacter sp.]|uniref:Uma2 family endonuclease n=1 Tax=Salinibacter sp. TaxID=2065818 RepID=UPI0035D49D57
MPTTTTPAEEHQARWKEIVQDPSLRDLPYKVETNSRGQIVLSPHKNRHSLQQKAVQKKLDELLSGGEAFQEWAIATEEGTKQADVIWASSGRLQDMKETGDPTTLAPEVCVEIMSDTNDWAEMEEKRRLYREAGAAEVWVVGEDGEVHFFRDEEVGQSEIVPAFPDEL